MFTKLSKHRSFQYTPRFYDPEKEQRNHPGIRIRRQRHRTKGRSLIWMIATLGLVMYLLYFLLKLQQ